MVPGLYRERKPGRCRLFRLPLSDDRDVIRRIVWAEMDELPTIVERLKQLVEPCARLAFARQDAVFEIPIGSVHHRPPATTCGTAERSTCRIGALTRTCAG